MDDHRGLNVRHWGYFEQPLKRSLGLQLMPNLSAERATKPLLSSCGFLHRDHGSSEPSIPMSSTRDRWIRPNQNNNNKMLPSHPLHHQGYVVMTNTSGMHTTAEILHPPNPSKKENVSQADDSNGRNDASLKKRARPVKAPKQKKPKKVNNEAKDDANNGTVSKRESTTVLQMGDWRVAISLLHHKHFGVSAPYEHQAERCMYCGSKDEPRCIQEGSGEVGG